MSHPARSTSRVLASPTVAIVGGGGRSGTQAPAGTTAKASEKDRARDGCEEEPGTPRRVRGRDRAGFARSRPVGVARGAAVTRDGKAAGDGPAANRVVAGAGRRGGVVAARRRGVAVGGGGAARGRLGTRRTGTRGTGTRGTGTGEPGTRAAGTPATGTRAMGIRTTDMPGTGTGGPDTRRTGSSRALATRRATGGGRETTGGGPVRDRPTPVPLRPAPRMRPRGPRGAPDRKAFARGVPTIQRVHRSPARRRPHVQGLPALLTQNGARKGQGCAATPCCAGAGERAEVQWFARRPSITACGRMRSPQVTRQCRASRNLMSLPSGGRGSGAAQAAAG